MNPITVAANQVRVGDKLYNSREKHLAFKWSRVISVESVQTRVTLEGGSEVDVPGVRLNTASYSKTLMAEEAISVMRRPED
jgi:hypothetical protein